MEALERGQPVCNVSLHHLSTAAATLIAISGDHCSRVHRQYRLYRDTAHDLRRRLHHHASLATARRRSSSGRGSAGGGGAAAAGATADAATGDGSSCCASAAGSTGGGGGAGALSRLMSVLSGGRRTRDSLAGSDGQGGLPPSCTAHYRNLPEACSVRQVVNQPM